jgi:AraC family transcriptional regulator of arabinose operon
MDWRIEKVIQHLGQRGCTLEPRSAITDLARSVNLSPSRLRHLFKAETGLGLKKCLIESRLETGRELLESSLLTVKEITARVGYIHASHFVRDFKRTYQSTPAHYRRHHLGGKYPSDT